MKTEGYTESRHDQTREQRAADRAYPDAKPQTFVRGAEKTREARYFDHLKRNGQKHEGDREVVKSGAANPKPGYLKQ